MASSALQRELSSQDIILFCDTLEAIRAAGVPLDLGLLQAAPNVGSNLSACMERLGRSVSSGKSLEEAIAAEEQVLPPVFRAALISGFSSDKTAQLLQEISTTSRALLDLNVAVRRGFVYPLILVLTATLLSLFVMRRLSEPLLGLYETLNVDPPRLTRMIAELNTPAFSTGLTVLAGVFAGLILWLLYSAFSQQGIAWERGNWLPGMGSVLKYVHAARFAQTLSLLVNHQTPLPRALRLVAPLSGSSGGAASLTSLAEGIESGKPAQELIERASTFPPLLRWLIVVGHRENSLGATLADAAKYYRQKAMSLADWLSTVVPVVVVLVIGGGVTLMYGLMLFGPMIELWGRLNVQ